MPRDLISIEKKQYRKDTLSYSLSLLSLLFNALYFITFYKNNDIFYYEILMGLSVIYNLVFMLMVFLGAEEVKVYNRKFSFVLLVFGILQIFRIFYYPKIALDAKVLALDSYQMITVYLVISSIFLVLAAITSFWNSTVLKRYVEGKFITSQE